MRAYDRARDRRNRFRCVYCDGPLRCGVAFVGVWRGDGTYRGLAHLGCAAYASESDTTEPPPCTSARPPYRAQDRRRPPWSMWAVYEQPLDHPRLVVARRWDCGYPTTDLIVGRTRADVRSFIHERSPGAIQIPPHPSDDPSIVELWI